MERTEPAARTEMAQHIDSAQRTDSAVRTEAASQPPRWRWRQRRQLLPGDPGRTVPCSGGRHRSAGCGPTLQQWCNSAEQEVIRRCRRVHGLNMPGCLGKWPNKAVNECE